MELYKLWATWCWVGIKLWSFERLVRSFVLLLTETSLQSLKIDKILWDRLLSGQVLMEKWETDRLRILLRKNLDVMFIFYFWKTCHWILRTKTWGAESCMVIEAPDNLNKYLLLMNDIESPVHIVTKPIKLQLLCNCDFWSVHGIKPDSQSFIVFSVHTKLGKLCGYLMAGLLRIKKSQETWCLTFTGYSSVNLS